ncbi:MAG: hypothetical protein HQ515_10060 [Phycisphaeraceae bacterium]|nr:hypothetical protein [Phycisphaeraceae bacterium]
MAPPQDQKQGNQRKNDVQCHRGGARLIVVRILVVLQEPETKWHHDKFNDGQNDPEGLVHSDVSLETI